MSDRMALHLADSCATAAAHELQSLRSEVLALLPLLTHGERVRLQHVLSTVEATSSRLFTSLSSAVSSH